MTRTRRQSWNRRVFAAVNPDAALSKNDEDRKDHLRALGDLLEGSRHWHLQEWMHHNLNVLDAKANSALQFNALLLAALTFLAAQPENSQLLPRVVLSVALILTLWSALRLARFCYVEWSSTKDYKVPDQMLVNLLRVRDQRTRIMRICWLRGAVALVLVGAVLAGNLTGLTPTPKAQHPSVTPSGLTSPR